MASVLLHPAAAETTVRPRVAFVQVMPTPYLQDLFRALQQTDSVELQVFYMEQAAPDTYWESASLPANATVLPGRWFGLGGARLHLNPGMLGALQKFRPDLVVVAGYSAFTTQAVMLWLSARRVPWVQWGEVPGMQRRSVAGRCLRWLAQRPGWLWARGIVGVGARAVRAYRQLLPRGRSVWNIPYHCDLDAFLAIPRTRETREPGCVRFLYCGQLIQRKGVDILLRAFCRLAAAIPTVDLILVGEGPLRATLEGAIPPELRSRVTFTGFQQTQQLPAAFGTGDVFVLPSRHDGWGVVVNQALAAGMPLIVTDAVGAGDDLVQVGANGCVVPAEDEEALIAALRDFATDPQRVGRYAAHSRRLAAEWTPQKGAERWQQVFWDVLGTRPQTQRQAHQLEAVP